MRVMQNHTCVVCGNIITAAKSIERGMGPECSEIYNKIRFRKAMNIEGVSLHYNWLIKVDYYISLFIEIFQEKRKRFRSDFKKSFYDSVTTSSRVSKKQLAIVADWVLQESGNLKEHLEVIDSKKKEYIRKIIIENDIVVSREEIEKYRQSLRKS